MSAIFSPLFFIGLFIYLLIGGFTLRIALTIVSNYSPPIGTCMLYQFVMMIVNGVVGALLGLLLGEAVDGVLLSIFSFVLGVIVSAVTLNLLVNDPETGKLGVLKALLVLVLQAVVLFVICFLPLFFLGGGMAMLG